MAELSVELRGDAVMRSVMERARPGLLEALAFAIADDSAYSILDCEQERTFVPHVNDPDEAGQYWFDRAKRVYPPAKEGVARAYEYLLLRGRVRIKEDNPEMYLLLEADGTVRA